MTALVVSEELRDRLIGLSKCASTDKARPVLGCLCFDGDEVWATDSFVLGRVPLPDTVDGRLMVPAAPLATALRRAPKVADVTLTFRDTAATLAVHRDDLLTNTAVETTFAYFDQGEFPKVKELLPSGDLDGEPCPINATQVARLAASYPADKGAVRLRFQPSPTKPVVVESMSGDLLGLVMPMLDAQARRRAAEGRAA